MKKTTRRSANLSLTVQYGTVAVDLPRWRLRRWVQRALDVAAPGQRLQLTLRLVDRREGRMLNATYRKRDYATNVLTFDYGPADQPSGVVCADLIMCVAVLKEEARQQRKTFVDHAAHLVVHGTLHALGHDHQTDRQAREMEDLEAMILATLGVANPYEPLA